MEALKSWLVPAIGLSQDSLHTYAGFIVFFAASLLLRKPPSSLLPWLCLLVLAVSKELYDIIFDLRVPGQWIPFKSAIDVFSVMIWPTLIMFMVRFGIVFKKQ